jgi:uncharacterized protein
LSEHFLRGVLRAPTSQWVILNVSTGALLATNVVPAFDRRSRNQGLLQHTQLKPGDAMILAPCFSVHTWFMRFPIDVLFVARSGRVLKARSNVAPWRIAACLGAFAVIELPPGGGARVDVGDRLELEMVVMDQSKPARVAMNLAPNGPGSDAGQKYAVARSANQIVLGCKFQ